MNEHDPVKWRSDQRAVADLLKKMYAESRTDKRLDQSVFNDAPDWAEWAFVNAEGAAWLASKKPRYGKSWSHRRPCFYTKGGDAKAVCIGSGYNTEGWRDSPIQRNQVAK